jgi:hypothetical protein
MSREANDTHEVDAGLTLAVIGSGAVLLWLLLRGRGKGSRGQFEDKNGSRSPGRPSGAPRRLVVRTRPGDRVEVDGIDTDLATVLVLALNAGSVEFHTSNDARAGWVSKVFYALTDAGVDIWIGPEIRQPVTRFPANKQNDRGPTEAPHLTSNRNRNA